MTLEDIAAFWKSHSAEIILILIAAIVSFVFGKVAQPKPLRRAWEYKTRIKRLEDEIARQDKIQENPVKFLALAVRWFIPTLITAVLGVSSTALFYALLPHEDSLANVYLEFVTYGIFIMIFVRSSLKTFRRLRWIALPTKCRNELVQRLEKLKERGY